MRQLFAWAMIACLLCPALSTTPASSLTPVPVHDTIHFDKDSADLTASARMRLNSVASSIRYHGGTCFNVRISGHVDRAEAKAGNRGKLDLKRATTVRDFLRAMPLLEGHSFDVFAYGDESPALPKAPDDEPKNRRVEVNWDCPKAQ